MKMMRLNTFNAQCHHQNPYIPKRKNPSVTQLQNPSVGFQSKIKNQAWSAVLCAALLTMSIYANLIKSSGYYSPLKYKT